MDAVLTAERALGRAPEEMPPNNPGYDIRSTGPDGHLIHLEVKGRLAGADDFFVTLNEVLHGKNSAPRYRLALVSVSPDGADRDEIRYLAGPFARIIIHDFTATGIRPAVMIPAMVATTRVLRQVAGRPSGPAAPRHSKVAAHSGKMGYS